jgi:hypothetical protein
MPFIKIEGFAPSIYVPEKNQGKKKHPCRDCYNCQFCSDERCELCLKNRSCRSKHSEDNKGDKSGAE